MIMKIIMNLKKQLTILFFISLIFFTFNSCNTTKQLQDQDKLEDNNEQIVDETSFEEEEKVEIETVVEVQENIAEEKEPELTPEEEEAIRWAGILKEAENMSTEQRKFYLLKKTRDYEVVGADLDYKVMVNDDTKEVIIQFEESDSEEDWKNNYLFMPWPLKLDNKVVWTTYGYAKIYKSAKGKSFEDFYTQIEAHPDYKVVIWGWSIGSVMAKITARHFEIRTKKQRKIDELTTWGDVKCWYNPFYSVKKSCVKIREYVTPNDIITWCVPICRRDVKTSVGKKFSFKEKDREHFHCYYEEYDYSKWENE